MANYKSLRKFGNLHRLASCQQLSLSCSVLNGSSPGRPCCTTARFAFHRSPRNAPHPNGLRYGSMWSHSESWLEPPTVVVPSTRYRVRLAASRRRSRQPFDRRCSKGISSRREAIRIWGNRLWPSVREEALSDSASEKSWSPTLYVKGVRRLNGARLRARFG